MTKRIRFILAIIITGFIIYLPIWRFLPQSFVDMMNMEEDSISIESACARVYYINEPVFYRLEDIDLESNMSKEILDILALLNYKPDFRNLLPWKLKSLNSDKNFDGRFVELFFRAKNGEVGFIHFMSSSLVHVYGSDITGNHIYHPTDSKAFDALMEYVREHGVKQ